MALLISGPGYSGKSTFILKKGAGIVRLPFFHRVEYLVEFWRDQKVPYRRMVLHFNTNGVHSSSESAITILNALKSTLGRSLETVVLVPPESELRERIFLDSCLTGRGLVPIFQARRFISKPGVLLGSLTSWINLLKSVGIAHRIVASTSGRFREIAEHEVASVVAQPSTRWRTTLSYADVQAIADRFGSAGLQRIELPYGLHIPGAEVWQHFPIIFPPSMKGESVLDAGCGLGAFAFEAERRGARVVATDPDERRLQHAASLGRALGSSVEFRDYESIMSAGDAGSAETFDYVLALDHADRTTGRAAEGAKLAQLTRKRLFVEVHADRAGSSGTVWQNSDLPAWLETQKHFARVSRIAAPTEGRVLAICERSVNDGREHPVAERIRRGLERLGRINQLAAIVIAMHLPKAMPILM